MVATIQRPSSHDPAAGPPGSSAEVDRQARRWIRILVVDDERTLRESCCSYLKAEGYTVELAGKGKEALDLLTRRAYDIVLLDQFMSEVSGSKLMESCLTRSPDTLVIVMTGNPSVQASLDALRAGAWDYLVKPFPATQLQILIGRAAHTVMVAREASELSSAHDVAAGNSDKVRILGVAPSFRRAIAQARQVARTDASVFITGESGTGKELVAQFIHHHSRRCTRRIVAVNCAALPETLLESEMFGHRKGAFTGAVRDKPGLLETANGGTMLLDEVTEMTTPIQAKLLRVIQDGVVRRVGSEDVDAVVNLRFIAATNHDPNEAVESGILRQDLFYRLYVVPISLPPLRERQEDIPLMANSFLQHFWNEHRDPLEARPAFTDGAMQALARHPWPGNVRQLQNLIEHLVVLAQPGGEIQAEHLPFMGAAPAADAGTDVVSLGVGMADQPYHAARERVLAEFERRYFTLLVNRANGNLSKAARIAGVQRSSLYRLMERHGMRREFDADDTAEA
jgi:DNA-binding NtrC family response regulator